MTREEKNLLLKDLCSRLPYLIKVGTTDNDGSLENVWDIHLYNKFTEDVNIIHSTENVSRLVDISEIRPYLRPMSSMTEEEKEDLKSKCTHTETEKDWEGIRSDRWGIQILEKYDTRNCDNPIWTSTINMDAIDWLNKNHFDYRGLIEKGLAIDATGLNIY